jgi:hypothetical protein
VLRAHRERPRCCRAADERDEFAPFHCPMPPVLPTERIAHLSTAGDCCAAGFQSGLCRRCPTELSRRATSIHVRSTPGTGGQFVLRRYARFEATGGEFGIDEHGNARGSRPQLTQEPKLLCPKFHRGEADTGTLPPGWLRLATRPCLTGSSPVAKTIGTFVVAALAASAPGVFVTITATGRRNKLATSAGSRSS